MEIKNAKHNQQANTKLSRKLIRTMTPQDALNYELAYAEYNKIHHSLCECVSTVQGVRGNKYKKQTVKEIL